MALEDAQVFRAALVAYERGRIKWAALSVLPLLIIPCGSVAVGHRLMSSVVLGLALMVFGGVLLWRGQAFGRGLTTGLKAGLVPLALSHGANLYGHVCTASGCASLCVPACVLGGAIAGALVAWTASRSVAPLQVLGSGAVTACLMGAFGCACVGFGGVAGMVLGTGAALATTRLWSTARG